MFAPISPRLKDVTIFANNWIKDQTLSTKIQASSLGNKHSPAFIMEGRGWSGGTQSVPIAYKQFVQAVAGSPAYGAWKLQYSTNNSAYADAITYQNSGFGGAKALTTFNSYAKINTDNGSTVDTLLSLQIDSTGGTNHVGLSSSGVTRAAWSANSSGIVEYRSAGSSAIHNFYYGSTISSQSLIAQIYSLGIYNTLSTFTSGKVTAGNGDQSVQTTLSTYGSFAARGILVTSASYTLTENETMVYVDPSNAAFCVGSPTACNTYGTEGACNAHTGVGCSWFAGTDCGDKDGTSESDCESGRSGCNWDEVSCSSADNTDQSTCENQDDSFGGSCSWDTTTCPAFTTIATCDAEDGCTPSTENCTAFNGMSEATCEFNGECVWTGADCHAFDATDQSTCETSHTGCVWDSMNSLCDGVYDEASTCAGTYLTSCSGNLCNGNYFNGNCSGTFGTLCQGTANCTLLTSSGPCASESGCSWQIGIILTLPTTANASRGTTGRIYSIMHVGNNGTVAISGQSGQPVFQYTTLNLLKKGDKALLHNQNITFFCSIFTSSGPCSAQTGCTWVPACSSYGDESSCTTAGCTWDGSCTGASEFCSGSYSNGAHWYAHSLERGISVVEKTANYTLTDIDDIVVATANSFTMTLPSAALSNGKEYTIKNFGTGTITINTTSSQTIDEFASGEIELAAGDSMSVVSNNSNWYIR